MVDDESVRRGGTLEAGLRILEWLVERPRGAGVTELATALSLDKANAHRLLRILASHGYVDQLTDSRRYVPTAQIIVLAGSMLRGLDLRAAAEGPCNDLLSRTTETVHLSQVTRSGPVYVLQRRPPFRVSVETEIGARPPLHATATGKAIIAFLDEASLETWLPEPFEQFTYRTHRDRMSLDRDLEQVRSRGYAIDDEELNPGTRCVAAPVFGLEGEVVGCVGVSTPTQRVSLHDLERIAAEVVHTATIVTERLGGPVSMAARRGEASPMSRPTDLADPSGDRSGGAANSKEQNG